LKIERLREGIDDPKLFLYLDRYVNGGSKGYSPFSNLFEGDLRYKPENRHESFPAYLVKIPREKISLFTDNPHSQIYQHYVEENSILFPVHPETYEDDQTAFIEEIRKYPYEQLIVAPTASTRTVMNLAKIGGLPSHFIKLHYPRRVSRFISRFRKNSIQNSVEASKELNFFSHPYFGYLPETLGISFQSDNNEKELWGCTIRELHPRPKAKTHCLLIPLFALFAQDLSARDDPPLLIQLLDLKKEDPQSWILEKVMKPLIQIWCALLQKKGAYSRDAWPKCHDRTKFGSLILIRLRFGDKKTPLSDCFIVKKKLINYGIG